MHGKPDPRLRTAVSSAERAESLGLLCSKDGCVRCAVPARGARYCPSGLKTRPERKYRRTKTKRSVLRTRYGLGGAAAFVSDSIPRAACASDRAQTFGRYG